ncbi:hypothetical protein SUGI_0697730 [Cryptomeria japonica]|nr:hypothetical protein SUGI_0697730 [Cryptomeria japonica]
MLFMFSQAERPIKDKSISHKGVMQLKNEANARLGLDEKPKPITSAHTLDGNSKKMKGFTSPVKMGEMISVEEDENNGPTTQPSSHSPGVGHNNPPGSRP